MLIKILKKELCWKVVLLYIFICIQLINVISNDVNDKVKWSVLKSQCKVKRRFSDLIDEIQKNHKNNQIF